MKQNDFIQKPVHPLEQLPNKNTVVNRNFKACVKGNSPGAGDKKESVEKFIDKATE